ncbi:MAG: Mur ligase family protein [Planctomycetota bacterium]
MKNKMDSIEKLFPHIINWEKTRKGKFTLKNIKEETKYFNYPQFKFKTIHIAGSKGKGTIVNVLANILQSMGFKIGTFTSPHLLKVEERIVYNGKPITFEQLNYYSQIIKKKIKKYKKEVELTYFEILTLLSFLYFSDRKIDYAIFEAGIGGSLDATNIIESQFQIITSIEYEHTEILGNTLEKIFLQKLGIGKSKSPILILDVSSSLFPNLYTLYEKKGDKVFLYRKDFYIKQNKNRVKYMGLYKPVEFELPYSLNKKLPVLVGGALFCTEYLTGKDLVPESLQKAIRKISPLYRIEVVSYKPLIIADVAHTKQSVKNLVESLSVKFAGVKFYTIFSSRKNKDVLAMLYYLQYITKEFIFCGNSFRNFYNSEELTNLYYTYLGNNCDNFSTIEEAIYEVCKRRLFPLLICGSFYNISSFLKSLKNNLYK